MKLPDRRKVLFLGAAAVAQQTITIGSQAEGTAPPLRRGVNVHHLLNWPEITPGQPDVAYVWPPFAKARYQIAAWELQRLRQLGFDFVRLTVDPAIYLASNEVRQAELRQLIIDRVRMFHAATLNVIVDMAPISQNPKFAPAQIVARDNKAIFNAYCAGVAAIARDLQGLPQDRLAFEPINEPVVYANDLPRWQAMAEQIHAQIRAAAPNLPLVICGALWGHFKTLVQLDSKSFRGSNLFYTFHYYDPHTFTHQSVQATSGRYIRALRWPVQEPQENAVARAADAIAADPTLNEAEQANWLLISKKLIAEYYASRPSAATVDADFKVVADWAKNNNIPNSRILMGEFGMTREGGAALEDRVSWLKSVRAAAERHGFPWALWVYRGFGGMALVDESPTHVVDPDVAAAIRLGSPGGAPL